MKKLSFILITLLMSTLATYAQKPIIQKSPSFEEPELGWNKIMQLSNGNTFFFHFTKKHGEGIQLKVYDKSRKLISSKNIEGQLWDAEKMKRLQIEGLYEIKGQPVLFFQQTVDLQPTLYRVVFDPQTGAVLKEDKLGDLMEYSPFAGYSMAMGNVPGNNAYVEKDPYSDCYAAVYFNGQAPKGDPNIEVVHYDGDHNEINRAKFTALDGKFKYLRYMAMTVQGDKDVVISLYAFNTRGDKDSRIVLAELKKGEKEFASNVLDFSEDFAETKGTMQFNPNTGLVQMLSLTKTNSKYSMFSGRTTISYLPIITYFDPATLKVAGVKVITGTKVSDYMTTRLDRDGYTGLPQNMIVNNDKTTTILMEEMAQVKTTSHTGATMSEKTELDNIGISVLNDTGGEKNGYAILKSQSADGLIPNMYLAEKGKGYWSYTRPSWGMHLYPEENNSFLSFDYLNTDKANYILFNDYPVNFDKDENKKRKRVQTISGTNTIVYKLMPNGTMTKYYLFGDHEDDDKSTFSYIESSSFDKTTKTYATLIVEREKRDKKARIAWVTVE